AYLTYASYWKRAAFVAAMCVAMIAANGVRAFIVMLVASATDMRWFAGRDHIYFGWVLFAVVVAAMVYLGGRLADAERSEDAPDRSFEPARRANVLPLVAVIGLVMLAATANPLQEDVGSPSLLLWPAAGLLLWVLFRRYGAVDGEVRASATRRAASYRR